MERACVIVLLHETPGTHGVHDAPTVQRRTRYAVRKSASRSEYYQAGANGLRPRFVLVIALAEEYDDEKRVELDGRTYDVVRDYENESGGIELTVQRSDS